MLEAASLFTDGAVLCRDREIRIFGRADNGAEITARLEDSNGRLLAEETAKKLRFLCRQLLIRQDERAHTQEGLNREKRIMNLANAFVPRQRVTFPVLLIDDVLTTGTTAGRCIRALRDAGARDITVLTFTHTR